MLEFLKTKQDKCKYALLYQIVGSTECEYYTDNENYFMARSDKQHAIWIWSKEDLNKNAFNDLKNANFDEVYNIIKPLGLAKGKANNIINLSKRIISEFDGEIPKDFDKLTSLSGVGRKTANVFLSEAFGENRLAVDTHVARVSKRLGLTEETDPEKVEKDLVEEFKDIKLHTLHHRMIFFGRYLCKSVKPECDKSPFICFCKEKNKE